MVFSIALRFLRDRAVAEELAQDVFLKLYRELPKLESPEHVKFWLRKVISHRSMDYSRGARVRREVGLDDVAEPASHWKSGDVLLQDALRKLVSSLPDDARMMIVLRYQEEMEPQEIANTLGIPVGTVKSRLRRSLVLLRGKVQRLMGEPAR
ncbi:MAG: sigma-70 family RNA polymerase sigma factor [Acidobacteria bacterium]|nr:sigma-70 family RNA polymerase sigma factor [Acidobacteriota bacterium]MBV9145581.1 sigma-70 family RNA polymerase sigma factor [Acidobacteriota bacterium]MBV9436694.1 sigma-70 family RNA polymerase sigma factor [Acidobacteriota bacterium]